MLRTLPIGLIASLALSAAALAADPGWTIDYANAKGTAGKEKKDLFLEFTGSDWCPPCQLMKKNIFDNDAFKAEAPKHFVLVKLDFPRDKSHQTEAEIAQNKSLQKQYEISGFPTVILADAAGRPYAKMVGFGGATAQDYVKDLAERRKVREARDAAFAKAVEAQGVEKAKLLDQALAGIDDELIPTTYRMELDQIIALDADGKAGLKAKYEAVIKLPQIKEKLEAIQQEAADTAAALKQIDELEAKEKPTGMALLELNFARSLIHYRAGDKEAAVKHLEAAAAAAPGSKRAEEIKKLIVRLQPKP